MVASFDAAGRGLEVFKDKVVPALQSGFWEASVPIWERGKGIDTPEEVKDYYQNLFVEPITNVTKGISEALPYIAIGGAAVIIVSALLSRH